MRNIDRRMRAVLNDIRDGCNDCPDKGILCPEHLALAKRLVRDPERMLPELEREYSASSWPAYPSPGIDDVRWKPLDEVPND